MSIDLGRDPFWAHGLSRDELTAVRAALEVRRLHRLEQQPADQAMPNGNPLAKFVHDARRVAKQKRGA